MSDSKFYYLDESNQPTGPLTLNEIIVLQRNGQLPDNPYLCRECEKEWQPLSEFLPRAAPRGAPSLTSLVTGMISRWFKGLCRYEIRLNSPVAKTLFAVIACFAILFLSFAFSPLLTVSLAVALLVFGSIFLRSYKGQPSGKKALFGYGAAIGVGGFVLNCMLVLILFGLRDSLIGPNHSNVSNSTYSTPSYLPSLEEMQKRHEIARELFFLQHGDTIQAADRWARETARFAEELERAKKR